jgi:cell division protein FtsQ
MAVKNTASGNVLRRVSLTRSGKGKSAARNTRREIPQGALRREKRFSPPWRGIGRCLLTSAALCFLLVFLTGISIVLLYSYRFLTTSAYFALVKVEIEGNSRLESREIVEIADLKRECNILALSINAIEGALSRNPWVEGVSVKRVLPGTLVIGIKEKIPAFWLLHENILHYADVRGNVIAPVEAGKFASLPILEVETGAEEAMAALPDLLQSLKESRLSLNVESFSWIRLSAARGLEIYIDDRSLRISIGLEEWLLNLSRLGKTLADLGRRGEMSGIREIRAQGANVWVEKAAEGGPGV